MKIEILSTAYQIIAAAANGIYQGAIVTLVVAFGLHLLRRTNAATRHAVWFCTLLLVVSLMMAHSLRDYLALTRPNSKLDATAEPWISTTLPEQADAGSPDIPEPDSAALEEGSGFRQQNPLGDEPKSARLPLLSLDSGACESPMDPMNLGDSAGALALSPKVESEAPKAALGAPQLRWLGERLLNPISWNLALELRSTRIASVLLLAFWLVLAGFRLSLLVWRLHNIRGLKNASLPPTPELQELFQRLKGRLRVKRQLGLKVSTVFRSPVLLGFLHPVILLPAEGPGDEAENVLRHELAHAVRCDDWVNLVQHCIQAVFFFHPAVWWIARRLSLEREIACDDHVLEQGGRPRTYALLLANLAGRLQKSPHVALLAPGASTNKSQLKQRIDMILDTNRNTSSRLAKARLGFITSAAAVIAIAAIYSAPRIVLAQGEASADAVSRSGAGIEIGTSGDAVASAGSDAAGADVAPGPAAVDPGPKNKPEMPGPSKVRPVGVKPPAIPSAPSAVLIAPMPPAPVVANVEPVSGPRPPRPGRAHAGDTSMEERLERLEHMVESLIAQQGLMKPGPGEFHLRNRVDRDGMLDRKELEKIDEFGRRQAEFAKKQAELAMKQVLSPEDLEKIKENAKREAARGAEQAKRAAKEIEKAFADQNRQSHGQPREGHDKQLEALRRHHEVLEREMEKLDRQIEQLERNRKKLDEQQEQSFEENENENENRNQDGNTSEDNNAVEPAAK